jgi:hypothetical protein
MLYLFGQLALSDSLFYDADYQVADYQPAAAPTQCVASPQPAARATTIDRRLPASNGAPSSKKAN